ncbi:MAG TPA: ABC transporter ATP-binding protein [Phycisphaerae bacterium]|jgi:iron complex transport system ATP-binding protein|nr:ABC transporter ATP-binding protein [Phycisphaerae bacterium]
MNAFSELSAHGVRFGYASGMAVDGVTASLKAGELVALVGPNGCGKSTLLKLLLGALSPAGGQVMLDGRPLATWGRIAVARRIALVPQMAGTGEGGSAFGDAGFTVRQTVMMARYAAHVEEGSPLLRAAGGLGIFGFETERDDDLARRSMWNSDVHHLVDRELESLSGGERQRVAIARALAQETPIVLLDEPTSALDLYHELELVDQLRSLARGGRLVVLVTHDLNLALECATRVLLMDRGKIVADGVPRAVLTAAVLEPVYHVKVVAAGAGLRFERSAGPAL